MSYQFLLALGDSITFGARATAGWPEFCVEALCRDTGLTWLAVNRGVNSRTALELLRDLPAAVASVPKKESYGAAGPPYVVTVCIGANDAKEGTDPVVYAMVYSQVLRWLTATEGQRRILCIAIPSFVRGLGYVPYGKAPADRVADLNAVAEVAAKEYGAVWLDAHLETEDYADSVHPNTKGQRKLAEQVAFAIRNL